MTSSRRRSRWSVSFNYPAGNNPQERSRDSIFGPGMFCDTSKGYRQVGNGNRCEFSSSWVGKRETSTCHAMLFYSTRHPTRLLCPSHELIYMFPRPILPILPSNTSKPRVPTHAILPIVTFPPSYRSVIIHISRLRTHHSLQPSQAPIPDDSSIPHLAGIQVS